MATSYASTLPVDNPTEAVRVVDQTLHAGEPGSGAPLDNVTAWDYYVVNATGVNVVFAGACVFGGWEVMGAAGAHTLDVYDNASAASGQKLVNGQSVASAASSRRDSGIRCLNGIVANMSGDPTDAQILIFYKEL